KAGMTWNDNADVCGVSSGAITATSQPTAPPETSGQPLTRADCDKASMAWNDRANVCGLSLEEAKHVPAGAPKTAAKTEKTKPKAEAVMPSPKKKTYTHRGKAPVQTSQPVERGLFILFPNRNRPATS